MSFAEIFLIGIGLSMDAFAVSVINGMCRPGSTGKTALSCGICFGLFQGFMPSVGYALGSAFSRYIERYDHIIALVLLGYIGGKMVYDSVKGGPEEASGEKLKLSDLILQGVATSIDALAVGVSFAAMIPISKMAGAACLIATTTFIIAFSGAFVGKKFGDALNNKAQLVGGLILIAIGVKIFVEHTFFG